MPAPHFGEEGYIFLQNTRRVNQQYNDLRYCGEFSNIDADAVALPGQRQNCIGPRVRAPPGQRRSNRRSITSPSATGHRRQQSE